MILADRLKYERLNRGMTQFQFAELLETNRSAIGYYENGRIPLPVSLKKFSNILKVDLAKELIEGKTN